MTRIISLLFIITFTFIISTQSIQAQVDSGFSSIHSAEFNFYPALNPDQVGDADGSGRFLVFESTEDAATVNPRNSDGNFEIFLMDSAQRHIFQITDTKSTLADTNGSSTEWANIKILLTNIHPSISNDGKWIAFESNGTTNKPSAPNSTNPGNLDGNSQGTEALLQQDGTGEIWLYELPTDPTSGEVPQIDLGTGSFTQVTNTVPNGPCIGFPFHGATNRPPRIALANHIPSIDDDGDTIAFLSRADLVLGSNSCLESPNRSNDEVFIYKRNFGTNGVISQITVTNNVVFTFPINQSTPTIAGDGLRVVFESNATNPIPGMTGGCNSDFNSEIIYSDLNPLDGSSDGDRRQVTFVDALPGVLYDRQPEALIRFSVRSMSRNGRYIVFASTDEHTLPPGDSERDLDNPYAYYLFDTTVPPPSTSGQGCADNENPAQFRQIGPRNHDDPILGTQGYSILPIFTDYTETTPDNFTPGSLVFVSRINFRADGTVPPLGSTDGLNPDTSRPYQIFSYQIPASPASPTFIERLTNSQEIEWEGYYQRIIPTNHRDKIYLVTSANDFVSYNLFQLLTPAVSLEANDLQGQMFFTGGGGIKVGPGTNEAAGLMPNMLGSFVYTSQQVPSNVNVFADVGTLSINRNYPAPLQFKGVTVTIDGYSAFVTGVTNGRVNFIVPKEVTSGLKPIVINHNGVVIRENVQIVSTAQPDVVTNKIIAADYVGDRIPASKGRAYVLDVTDPNDPQTEPFTITPQSKFRIFLTGVEGVTSNTITIQVGSETIQGSSILTNATEADYPGVYTFDFEMPTILDGAGNVPVVVSVGAEQSQPAPEAAKINIISGNQPPTDLAVWRPENGTWYIKNGDGTYTITQFGLEDDITAPGDYDGDGKTDLAIFRPSTGNWWIFKSSDNTSVVYQFGQSGDEVAQADYDGDGKTDIAVWRPSTGVWYVLRSSNLSYFAVPFGTSDFGDIPVSADYDGDGYGDIAVWRPSTGVWYILQSSDLQVIITQFGATGDIPVRGDYDGDGVADLATWRNDGVWRILNSSNNQLVVFSWGIFSTDIPVQGDYDSDGKTDIAVWRSSGTFEGWWYIWQSSVLQMRSEQLGQNGDIPVPAPYNRGN